MSRPLGSKNKTRKPPTKSVHVRLSEHEIVLLKRLGRRTVSGNIHRLIVWYSVYSV